MELTNRQRLYLGLEQVEPSWEQMEIPNSIKPDHDHGSSWTCDWMSVVLHCVQCVEGDYWHAAGYGNWLEF